MRVFNPAHLNENLWILSVPAILKSGDRMRNEIYAQMYGPEHFMRTSII